MISAAEFLEPARDLGFDFWAGVPCSYLKPFINYVIDDDSLSWLASSNEGDAVASATGAALAGGRGVAIMQNSGLGNAVSPLTSLNWVFRIPVLLIITLRGDPEFGDEPQHELMGRITTSLLDSMDIAWRTFPIDAGDIAAALDEAVRHMDLTGRPFALLMRKGSVGPHPLQSVPPSGPAQPCEVERSTPVSPLPSRSEVLEAIVAATPVDESVVFATTGYTGRELFTIADRPNQFYMVGSMGCATSLALGFALSRPDRRVVVADGDGAALMRMGNLATIGAYAGDKLSHVLLDNGMHESTGGQATVSHNTGFAEIAAACGYRSAARAATAGSVSERLREVQGPAFTHIRTAPGVPEGLPRPDISPVEVRTRLMRLLGVEKA